MLTLVYHVSIEVGARASHSHFFVEVMCGVRIWIL